MEDSSTNPFIPGSSDTLQRKVERPQTAFARLSKTILIVGGVLFLIIAIALIFILQNINKVDDKARAEFANALQPADQLSKLITIKSSLGFTVSYQNQLFTSLGELGASRLTARAIGDQAVTQSYEDNDLKKERNYGMVRITPIESSERSRAAVALPPELEINSYDKALLLQTDEQKAAEAEKTTNVPKGELAVSTFVAVDSKKRLADRTTEDGTIVSIEATKPVRQEIDGIEYQKVRYTTKNETHEITNEKYDDCYYTIQNSQPYTACVINVRPGRTAVASLLEDTMRLISYQVPAATTPEKAGSSTTAKDEEATVSDEEKDTEQVTITPPYIKEVNVLKAIAKNQPSIMRIGTLYCANIDLKRVDGSTGTTLTNACSNKSASGAFISKTGHIATAGHSVRFTAQEAVAGYINQAESQDEMRDRLQRVLDYLLKSGIIRQTTIDFLKTGASTGNQEALAKIENIGSIIPKDYIQARDEDYTYALQLTDKPIVVNRATGNKPSFAYSDTVVKATFERANYDTSKYSRDKFETSHSPVDVAILKTDGTFPVVTIGTGNDLGANQKLATVGFPALIDSNLTTDKILNIPVATMSSVNQTFDLEGQKIIDVNTPILPGNDGAPVFNESAALVGFAAYGPSYCPDRQCFGSGTVRSSNELSALIDKHNMEIENKSTISDTWAEGVDAYFAGNYQTAAGKFTAAGNSYGFNQFATKLVELAKSKNGSPSDTSLMNQLAGVSIGTLIFLAVAMTILGILLFIHLKRLDMLRVGHYGAAVAAPVAPQPIMQSPVQPPQAISLSQSQQNPWAQQPYQQQPPQSSSQYPEVPVQNSWQQPSTSPAEQAQPPVATTPPARPQQTYQQPSASQSDDPFYRQ